MIQILMRACKVLSRSVDGSLRTKEALVGPEERLMDGDAFVARWQGGCRSTTAGHGGKAYLETLGAGGAG